MMDYDQDKLIKQLGAVPVLSALTREELKLFIDRAEFVRFPKNTVIIEQGAHTTGLYIVISGKVRVYLTGDDDMFDRPKEVSLSIEGEGSYIGEISLLDLEPRTASVKTLEDSTFLLISREALTQVIHQNPEVALSLINGITKRFRSTIDSVKRLAFSTVYKRLVAVLMEMSEPDGDKRVIKERLTHQYLADMVGSSRVMVSRILKDLSVGGYVTTEKGQMVIHRKLPDQY
ncbi:MAG: Crp/Fnr family transcriptional regulator [Gammaproteobacteria bacterium]|nr:Crp/Fnr family transcriptional regulator [Gammaproteobacteria bacterium]